MQESTPPAAVVPHKGAGGYVSYVHMYTRTHVYMYMCVSREGFGRSNIYICDTFGPPDAPVSYFVRFERPETGRFIFFVFHGFRCAAGEPLKEGYCTLYTVH